MSARGDHAGGVAGLPVRERAAEDVRRALRPGDVAGTGVGHDQQGVAFLGRTRHRQRHARVHGAHKHIDLVTLDELVDVVDGLAGVALVIDLEVLDAAAGQGTALLLFRCNEKKDSLQKFFQSKNY